MRYLLHILFLIGFTNAQSLGTIFWPYNDQWDVTYEGCSAGTTAYGYHCPSGSIGFVEYQSTLHASGSSGSPAPTPAPSLPPNLQPRRHSTSISIPSNFCLSYQITQAPTTYTFHMEDPVAGAYSINYSCSWEGQMTTANLTCTESFSGYAVESSLRIATTETLGLDDFRRLNSKTIPIPVATSLQLKTESMPTPSPTGNTPTPSPTASISHTSVPAATAAAALGPLPTGVAVVAGGVAGIFAAALAL